MEGLEVEEQQPHCDFGKGGIRMGGMFSIIYAVTDGVKLFVQNCQGTGKRLIEIYKGECILLDATCVHAGYGYDGKTSVIRTHHMVYKHRHAERVGGAWST